MTAWLLLFLKPSPALKTESRDSGSSHTSTVIHSFWLECVVKVLETVTSSAHFVSLMTCTTSSWCCRCQLQPIIHEDLPVSVLTTVLKSRDGFCWLGFYLLENRFCASDELYVCLHYYNRHAFFVSEALPNTHRECLCKQDFPFFWKVHILIKVRKH